MSLDEYTGAESFLVGISPSYWAHVPMCIRQVHDLRLIRGVQCMVADDDNKKAIPVSKCRLVASIVCAERKSNGCVLYVIDDGTGLIDCLHWDAEDDLDGLATGLPSLTGLPDPSRCMLAPGETVQVMGRIQCVAIETTKTTTLSVQTKGGKWKQCQSCPAVREIHASSVERVVGASRAAPSSLDAESQHWITCISTPKQNSLDVLQRLGPAISAQVADQSNLPAADDSVGAWRLYGTQCRCDLGAIQEELLYCHCIATAEPMDVGFKYRDALLRVLLEAEATVEDDHLRFKYRQIVENQQLFNLAKQQTDQAQTIVRNTVRALRTDGILYLIDENSDTYLLVSRKGVLEPYVQRSLGLRDAAERTKFYSNRPAFLDKVPRARMQVVRRTLFLANTESRDQEPT